MTAFGVAVFNFCAILLALATETRLTRNDVILALIASVVVYSICTA